MKIENIFADEVASPQSTGGFFRLRPGIVKIQNGRILSVEKASAKSFLKLSSKTRREKTIVPGLVDAHTHLVFAGDRADEWGRRLSGETYQQIAASGGGIKKTVRETRKASFADLTRLAEARLKRALKVGVTTIEIKTGYGLDLDSELKLLNVIKFLKTKSPQTILTTFMGAHAVPAEAKSKAAYIELLLKKILPAIKGHADFQDVFCETGYFNETESLKILKRGLQLGLKPKVHAHEFGRTGGVKVAAKGGALSADHLIHCSDADMALMKKKKVVPIVLPGTSFFLGAKKFAPALKMWKKGLKVAIASDFNPGTNPTLNLPLVGTFAAIHQGLSLEQVLTAQTYHGALALGLKDRGCIQKGMRADIIGIDSAHFEEIYYRYGDFVVGSVYVAGTQVL